MKKIFLAIPILLFLVGCEYYLPSVEYAPAEIPNEPTIILETNETYDKIVFDTRSGVDAVYIDGQLAWSVAYATDEFLSEYDSYVEFIEEADFIDWIRDYRYAFLSNITLYDFQWIELGGSLSYGDNGVFLANKENVLYSAGDLPPGVPFVVTPIFRNMSDRGISFLDENGMRRYFRITLSMAGDEGLGAAFVIIEFDGD